MKNENKLEPFVAPSRTETYPAEEMIPRSLLAEIQKHFVGGRLYIPHCGRGERIERNRKIRRRYAALMRETKSGYGVTKTLALEFGLTAETIRLVLRNPESWVEPDQVLGMPN